MGGRQGLLVVDVEPRPRERAVLQRRATTTMPRSRAAAMSINGFAIPVVTRRRRAESAASRPR